EIAIEQCARLGGPHEQGSGILQQTSQDRDRARLGRLIEVDQQVSAKDRVVRLSIGEKVVRMDVAGPKTHRFAHDVQDFVLVSSGLKIPFTEAEIVTAKGVLAIGAAPGGVE